MTRPSKQDYLADIRALSGERGSITYRKYRDESKLPERGWRSLFGKFTQFKAEAGLTDGVLARKLLGQNAKHAQADVYRDADKVRQGLSERYKGKRHRKNEPIILGASDMHDMECDRFYLRVLIDTARQVQPDIINLTGDIFDLPEFPRFDKDSRDYSLRQRIDFVKMEIITPLREAAPNAQIDLIEGNHEYRLCKYIYSNCPEIATLLDYNGIGIEDLLGLKKLEVNYIAKGSLAAFNKTEETREIEKGMLVYYDSIICSHEPNGMDEGYPGWNGHHHKFKATPRYNRHFGHHTWFQLGGGHRRSATYANGRKWGNGFILAHIHVPSRTTNFEYIDVGSERAAANGKYYYRKKGEV